MGLNFESMALRLAGTPEPAPAAPAHTDVSYMIPAVGAKLNRLRGLVANGLLKLEVVDKVAEEVRLAHNEMASRLSSILSQMERMELSASMAGRT